MGEDVNNISFSFEPSSCLAITYTIGSQVVRTIGKYEGIYTLKHIGQFFVLSDCDGYHFINVKSINTISVINKSSLDKITEDDKDPQKQLIARVCKCK